MSSVSVRRDPWPWGHPPGLSSLCITLSSNQCPAWAELGAIGLSSRWGTRTGGDTGRDQMSEMRPEQSQERKGSVRRWMHVRACASMCEHSCVGAACWAPGLGHKHSRSRPEAAGLREPTLEAHSLHCLKLS